MLIDHTDIKQAVIRSQHCQRNFDLSKEMPESDIDLLIHAATNCPSKQNISFYDLHVITNRDTIAKIHELSTGVTAHNYVTGEREIDTTNSQVMANVLFAFVRKDLNEMSQKAYEKWFRADEAEVKVFERDVNTALGIAAGYVNVIASILGYGTGCCQCFQKEEIRKLMGWEKGPELLMGVGYKNDLVNRRIHATEPSIMFPTRKKEEISITCHK
jgi:nitroreductase